MSVSTYEELAEHADHEIQVSVYGEQNAAVECVTCGMVLIDYDKEQE